MIWARYHPGVAVLAGGKGGSPKFIEKQPELRGPPLIFLYLQSLSPYKSGGFRI